MNKDAAVHICNACNKTLRKKFIKDFTFNQIMVLLLWNSQQRRKLFRMPHINFLTMLKVYKIFFVYFKDVIHFFYIFCQGTPQRDVLWQDIVWIHRVWNNLWIQQDNYIKLNTRQNNYVSSKYWMVTDNKCL